MLVVLEEGELKHVLCAQLRQKYQRSIVMIQDDDKRMRAVLRQSRSVVVSVKGVCVVLL